MRIETVDDFLAFEAIRIMVAGGLGADTDTRLAKALEGRFEFMTSDEVVSNEWLDCGCLHVKRLDDSITLKSGMLLEFNALENFNPRGFLRVCPRTSCWIA